MISITSLQILYLETQGDRGFNDLVINDKGEIGYLIDTQWAKNDFVRLPSDKSILQNYYLKYKKHGVQKLRLRLKSLS
jgi:hypothetical protein